MTDKQGCKNCRHHSKSERRKALAVGDGDFELVEFADEPQTVFMCRHPGLEGRPKEMGAGSPGEACELWEAGKKKGLDPFLARRVNEALKKEKSSERD